MKRTISVIILIAMAIPIGFFFYSLYQETNTAKPDIIYKKITSFSDIDLLKGKSVKPVLYTSVIPLVSLTVEKRKEAFISIMLPSILLAKHKIKMQREHVESILAKSTRSVEDQKIIDKFKKVFSLKDATLIPKKLVTHSTSIVLAQAAIESGWGSSRFFLQANNIFGMWSFNPKDDRIAAGATREGKTIYLKKYLSLEGSVYDYFQTLSKVGSYEKFREARRQTDNPLELIKYLDNYSELGDVYTQNLKTVIEKNDLQKYDDYKLALSNVQ
ncbi:MAG: glucosaminidase domain-containing protein [Sulfurospirillaceae bacterium]|nr:glucosaminidase domain-containing protein [Sulfurospirillaceae bacterium]